MISFYELGVQGRLGNQLWQLAGSLGMAARIKEKVCFPKWVYQPYFSLPDQLFLDEPFGQPVQNFLHHLDPRCREYMQDYHIWAPIEGTIRAGFAASDVVKEEFKKPRYETFFALPKPILSVHVRRGDNVTEGLKKAEYHPLRPTSYYHQAIAESPEYKSIAFFSDDIEWCKKTFSEEYSDAYFFEGGVARPKEHEFNFATAPVLDWIDFFLMVECDHHIISNSTYSWWAAFLGSAGSPIYPQPWFGRLLSYIDDQLMFPPHWKPIDHGPEIPTDAY